MITGETRVLALFGSPIRRSASPALHNRWLRALGIDAVYVCLETDRGDPAEVVRRGLWGANVTTPLKRACHPDRLEPEAAATGAVNTLYWDGGALVGANTDVEGFRHAAEAAFGPLAGRRVAVLGGGGAARAVAYAAPGATCFVRSPGPGERPLAGADLRGYDLVVNALPAAGRPAALAVRPPPGVDWFDLNAWDDDPPHRSAVIAAGGTFLTGHTMLERQARAAFVRFTGRSPPLD